MSHLDKQFLDRGLFNLLDSDLDLLRLDSGLLLLPGGGGRVLGTPMLCPVLLLLAVLQLLRTLRLSQKAESVSGLSVLLSPPSVFRAFISSEPELDLECVAEWMPRSVMLLDLSLAGERGDRALSSPEILPSLLSWISCSN